MIAMIVNNIAKFKHLMIHNVNDMTTNDEKTKIQNIKIAIKNLIVKSMKNDDAYATLYAIHESLVKNDAKFVDNVKNEMTRMSLSTKTNTSFDKTQFASLLK